MKAVVIRDGFFIEANYQTRREGDEEILRIGEWEAALTDDWREITKRIHHNRRIIVAEKDGALYPVSIVKAIPDADTKSWEFLNSDRRRSIKRTVGDIKNLARSKWDKIRDFGIAILIIVGVVAAIIVSIGIVSKFGIDQANVFRGIIKQTLINATSSVLGG